MLRPVGADYLRVAGTPLIRGRFITDADDRSNSRPVVVINQALARRYFPSADPVGQRLTFFGTSREIVGVLGDEHFRGAAQEVPPAVYPPFLQAPIPWFSIIVRTKIEPKAVVTGVEHAIWSLDPKLAIFNVDTLDHLAARAMARQRFNTLLLVIFGLIAVTLALVGIYGQLSYSVAQRQNEIGIRMAIGADRSAILRMILGEGARAFLLGTFLGLALAWATTRFLSSQLFGIGATDFTVFLAVPAVMVPIGLLACLLPSIRSTRMSPLIVMRTQ